MNRIRGFGRFGAAAVAALLLTQTGTAGFPAVQKAAAASFSGAHVSNAGSAEGDAVIRGNAASVGYDADRKSDVLNLSGSSFGSGWLQLPQEIVSGCKNGFSFSMRFKLASDAGDYTRLYQFATVPLGTGNSGSYNSPDLSMDLNRNANFRATVFAGSGSTTANDDAHRSIFTVSAGLLDRVKFEKLEVLILGCNCLVDISVFAKVNFPQLKTLLLYFCCINDISPLEKSKFPKLEHLNLGNNSISDLKALKKCNFPNLIELYLNENLISDIKVFEAVNFKGLKILNLAKNRITDIKVFENTQFENLEKLSLEENKFDCNKFSSVISKLKSKKAQIILEKINN